MIKPSITGQLQEDYAYSGPVFMYHYQLKSVEFKRKTDGSIRLIKFLFI